MKESCGLPRGRPVACGRRRWCIPSGMFQLRRCGREGESVVWQERHPTWLVSSCRVVTACVLVVVPDLQVESIHIDGGQPGATIL